ncbi:MAG TPA: TIM barrel protein [Phycisphaerae bacterium]|nr:TIM barrel protein [Phycisphaerae bacterium]HNU45073.1 TIM barrel protein [Phycisphaerae bacterium]
MKSLRVGVDSYSVGPLRLGPLALLAWAKAHEAEGVHFSDVYLEPGQTLDAGLLAEVGRSAAESGLYVEWGGGQHIPFDTTTWQLRDLVPINTLAAQRARAVGARVVRSCSGGLMRWSDKAPPTEVLLRETARALRAQKSLLTELGVVLAIELHFEFTTFELLRLFEMCEAEPGGYLGICLDTMNLLTMLEDPVAGTERMLPWVVAVHAKDGALRLTDAGLESFTTEIGNGVVDFGRIAARLAMLDRPVHLSVEDHGGSFALPIYDAMFLSRFPDLTVNELARLVHLAYTRPASVTPLDRAEWPKHCAARVERDIARLRQIVREQATGQRT